jgi:glutamine amidotransferase
MINPDEDHVAIVDYGMGNLFSVKQACEHVGIRAVITADRDIIDASVALILPGVGAFRDAMGCLERMDLILPVKEFISSGKPFMGICLGLQLLMSESEEFGINKGLNIIGGRVKRFPNYFNNDKVRVPHIGWDRISMANNFVAGDSVLHNIRDGEFMYFVHSYFVIPQEKELVITYTDYCGIRYCSAIRKNNLVAFQFHPEKSGPSGLQVFRNFKEVIYKEVKNG